MNTSLYASSLGYDPIKKLHNKNCHTINSLDAKEKSRIFIYSEYIKRRFYLDSNIKQENNKFCYHPYNNKQYYQINITDCYELIKYISEIIFGSSKLQINEKIFREKYFYNYKGKCTIFALLRYLYISGYFKIRDILINSINEYNKIINNSLHNTNYAESILNVTWSKCQNLLYPKIIHFDYLYNNPYDFYTYEKILNAISNDFDHPLIPQNTIIDFGIVVKYVKEHFDYDNYKYLIELYNKAINRYCLYFYDLIHPTDLSKYIFEDKKIEKIPRFFYLPKIAPNLLINDYIDFNFNPENKYFNFTIRNFQDISITDTISAISRYLTSNLYMVKNNLGDNYSPEDIELISTYIDSFNKHNQESDFIDRMIGLYLWDKCYRNPKPIKNSERGYIQNFMTLCKKKENHRGPEFKLKSLRQYQRVLARTKESIETFSYLPLA